MIPVIGGSPGSACWCGMAVPVGMDLVVVAVEARWDRIEIDPGGLDGLGRVRGTVTGQAAPRLHRSPTATARLARYACTLRV